MTPIERSVVSTRIGRSVVGLVFALAVGSASGACAANVPSAATDTPTGTPSHAASPSPSVAAAPTPTIGPSATPTPVPADGPPIALLAAEGGDAVPGQLGTYTWKESGSDAPWLPGAPIALGMGEPLSVGLVDGPPIGRWTARARPGGTTLPAQLLGDGSGVIEFGAPAAGVWSLAVEIHFADGSGVATYFWELQIG